MQQVHQYLDGERDYTLIKGDTGPLVYPAAHVYIYSALYRVTDGGKDIFLAQLIFGGLYLSILSLVMVCYRQAKVRINKNYCKYDCSQVVLTSGRFILGATICFPSPCPLEAHA